MKVDKLDWVEVGGQVSQASTYENKISKSSVFFIKCFKTKPEKFLKTHPHYSINKLLSCE